MNDVAYAKSFAKQMRALFRKQITKHLPHVKCRIRATGTTVAITVLDYDNELWPAAQNGSCQIRCLLERDFSTLPVGFYSVSYEHYA